MSAKILILNHNEKEKGTFFRCLTIAKQLANNFKFEVEMTSLTPLLGKPTSLKTKKITIDNIPTFLLTSPRGGGSLRELPLHIYRGLINTKIALTGNYDIVYAFSVASPTISLPVLLIFLAKKMGIFKGKLIIDWDDWWGKGGLTSLNKKGYLIENTASFLEEKLPFLADYVTVVSPALKKRAFKIGLNPQKTYYLPNGANSDFKFQSNKDNIRKKLKLPLNNILICYTGRNLSIFDYLVKSLQLVIKNTPSVKLLFISPLTEENKQQLEKANLKNNTLISQALPYEKMMEYHKACDILLLPRISDKVDKGGFPARLGDYMISGNAIVATDFGSVPQFIKKYKCGLLSSLGKPKDFADKIIKLISDKKLRKKLGGNGYQAASTVFSSRLIIESFVKKVLNPILKNRI